MKILVQSALAFAVTAEIRYGGMERLAWDFADELNKQGADVTLFCADGTTPPVGVVPFFAGFPATANLGKERDAVVNNLQRLRADKYDVVHDLTHQHWYPRIEGLSTPTISVYWHDPYIAKFPQPYHNVISLSSWAQSRFKDVYKQESIVQETILIDDVKYTYDPNITREDWFVFIGKLSHEKGCLDAIRICKAAGARLKIIGGVGLDVDSDEYQKEVIRQSTGDIEYLGTVDDETKIECLQKAKALIYPVNQMEITSYKNMEALMTGCPVVVYNRGGMSHTVAHGVTGLLVDTEEEFIRYLRDGKAIEEIQNKDCCGVGRARWGKRNVVGNYLWLYRQVANGYRWY